MPEKIELKTITEFLMGQRQLLGYENPRSSALTIVRELIENSLDACETIKVQPTIYLSISESNLSQSIYKVECADNGVGILPSQIPVAFGRPLSSSKYVNKQNRGVFGLGIKGALIYSYFKTYQPFLVRSATMGSKYIHEYTMKINPKADMPDIVNYRRFPNEKKLHGTRIVFFTEADFIGAFEDIKQYLHLTAMITPHAKISVQILGKQLFIERKCSIVPTPPTEVPPHPLGVDMNYLETMISKGVKTLGDFLSTFQRVGNTTASAFYKATGYRADMRLDKLSVIEKHELVKAISSFDKWLPPRTECLSLIGEKHVYSGIDSVYPNDFKCYSVRFGVYKHLPFAVEVCIFTSRTLVIPQNENPFKIFKFVNKVPLVKEYKDCLVYKVLKEFNWKNYNIDENVFAKYPTGVLVHICSPSSATLFKDLSKETIARIPELEHTLILTLRDCARKYQSFVQKSVQREFEIKRKNMIEMYLKCISESVSRILGKPCPIPQVQVEGEKS